MILPKFQFPQILTLLGNSMRVSVNPSDLATSSRCSRPGTVPFPFSTEIHIE